MRNTLIALLSISLITNSCTKDEESINPPGGMSASDGTYIGIVHLSSQSVADADIYNFERKDPGGSSWEELTWQSWNTYDDIGWALPNGKIIPGEKYEYRVRVHSDGPGFSEYTAIDKGYAYNTLPVKIDSISSTPDPFNFSNDLVTVFWTDSLPASIVNSTERRFRIHYAESTNLGTWFYATSMSTKNLIDKQFSLTYSLTEDRDYYFKVDTDFFFSLMEAQNPTESMYTVEGENYKE